MFETAAFAQRTEQRGYATLWTPESRGRNVLSHAAWLLARTERLIVATGIANIYARDAMAMANAHRGLNEQSGGRFLLGLGVSHAYFVEGLRRLEYGKPVATMKAYLEGMAAATYAAVAPASAPKTVLAALGPKMTELAGLMTDGAHPCNVPPEHTRQAREILGGGKLLCVEQGAILETDAGRARAAARENLAIYLKLPNYLNHWKRLGFSDSDFAGGGSDRLIDAVVVWGDEKAIRQRITEHWQAGADHVCVLPMGANGGVDERLLELLRPL